MGYRVSSNLGVEEARERMDGRVTIVALVVANQARSLEFYTEKVGFEIKTDFAPKGGSRFVTVGPKGDDLGLALWEVGGIPDPSQRELAERWSPGRAPPIVLRVADCRGLHRELSERGVRFLQPPIDHPWGTSATFVDPDGNLFSLNQPPGGAPPRRP
ncbi:MAG TPA: VOC family protein [Thermoplasmata archaeon]|nr:VOC family protein [Thermoplasmata archaeon]